MHGWVVGHVTSGQLGHVVGDWVGHVTSGHSVHVVGGWVVGHVTTGGHSGHVVGGWVVGHGTTGGHSVHVGSGHTSRVRTLEGTVKIINTFTYSLMIAVVRV